MQSVRASAAPWHQAVDFLIRDGKMVGSMSLLEISDLGSVINPTFSVDYTAAQTLMDDLWNVGLRPTSGSCSGSLAAVENHLKDIQKLVFKNFKD